MVAQTVAHLPPPVLVKSPMEHSMRVSLFFFNHAKSAHQRAYSCPGDSDDGSVGINESAIAPVNDQSSRSGSRSDLVATTLTNPLSTGPSTFMAAGDGRTCKSLSPCSVFFPEYFRDKTPQH